jgi:hypothetical protein
MAIPFLVKNGMDEEMPHDEFVIEGAGSTCE